MDKTRAASIFSRWGWLADTPDEFREALIGRSDVLRLPAGGRIDGDGGLVGIATGQIELHLATARADRSLSHICGPGHWIGDTAGLSGPGQRIDLVAGTSTTLLRVDHAELRALLQAEPSWWEHYHRLTVANQGLAVGILEALKREDPLGRVAMALLNLRRTCSADVRLRLTQTDLAAISSLSRRSVQDALGALQKRGLVRCGYALVELVDTAGLAAIL